MKTILEAIKAIDENADGSTIARALGGVTVAEAISEYEGGDEGGGGGGGGDTTYYTLSYDLMGYDESGMGLYSNGGTMLSTLPATVHAAGDVVDLSDYELPAGVTAPSPRVFGGWYLGSTEVTEVTMSGNTVLQAYWKKNN